MLHRFRTPRWRHADPKIRRQAVEALSWSDDAEVIAQVAREDAAPAIRRVALRHAPDLGLLAERAEDDPDADVRAEAERRYRELLAGNHDDAPPLAERMQRAADDDSPARNEFLAREGREQAIREQAIERVARDAVLRDVALKDPSLELRLRALDRIGDENVIERVYQLSRKSDKRVSRTARDRLHTMRSERERPQQVTAECQAICEQLEQLGTDPQRSQDTHALERLEQRWQALEPQHRHAFEAQFSEACEGVTTRLAAMRDREEPIRAAKEAVIAKLEALHRDSDGDEERDTKAWVKVRESALRAARETWRTIERLPDPTEHDLERRLIAVEAQLRTSLAIEQCRRALSRVLTRHERLLASQGAIAERDVKDLERTMDTLSQDGNRPALAALTDRVDKAHRALRDRIREQATWKESTLGDLPGRLDTLQSAIADGRASDAVAEHAAIAADLDALRIAGASAERLDKLRARHTSMARDVKVMRAWGRFGARQACERLCEQMEELTDAGLHPEEMANQIREARAAWKELARAGEGRPDQALWQRFDSAASAAYLPCKAFFEERAGTRKANLQRRRDLITSLERFLESSTGGPDMDWKGAVRFRRELLSDWQRAHPVERKAGKPLAGRLDARLGELDALLGRERERSARHREQLIEEATSLAANPDKKSAAEACKRLQREWQITVPGTRGEERALWQRFRGACDAVFTERQQVYDQERASVQAGLSQREALCQRIEKLLEAPAEELADAERELHRVQGEWRREPQAPRREGERLEKRFTAAVRRFARHKRALSARIEQAALEHMRAKAALCVEAENACAAQPPVSDVASALRTRWAELARLTNAEDEARMAERFEQVITQLEAPNRVAAAGDQDMASNLAIRESVCLRMEILAGVDSPPEHAQARMAEQVARLAGALADRGEAQIETPEDLLRAWCTTGPAPPQCVAELESRFERAWLARPGTDGTPGE